jgi:phenylalanyl-tRNA synthetase beta chain
MKVSYKHLINFIPSKPSIEEISKFFSQLGHEHEIYNNIFDMELTPNRGDCLSINGLLRDLAVFFEIAPARELYIDDIKPLRLNFINNAPKICPHISFLRIDIDREVVAYKGLLQDYFDDLDINKSNFFTDVSNYISYETGQPTHCYDAQKITNTFSLEINDGKNTFETLMNKKIVLKGKNLVFVQDNDVINLAGVMGGSNTACSKETKSVIIECAYFNPENIIGQSIKYDIKSDAAHKFERGVDPLCHEDVLRRFIKIVDDHTTIKNIEIFKKDYQEYHPNPISFNPELVNTILGTSINDKKFKEYLIKLGCTFIDNEIIPPSYRSDIKTSNDIAEEIARVVGYDNIKSKPIRIPQLLDDQKNTKWLEQNIKNFLTEHGFFEVINNPFINHETDNAIKVDNPLDSNRKYIRTNIKKSLIENLLYNERRQKDSIKLFEISDLYFYENEEVKSKKMIGIICSGRMENNYKNFSKKMNISYLTEMLNKLYPEVDFNPVIINRNELDTKVKNQIIYLEIELDYLENYSPEYIRMPKTLLNKNNFTKYVPISSFPSSLRDLSFAVNEKADYYELQELLLNFNHTLIKEIFVFDFFYNEAKDEIKIGFRFIFQSQSSTITDQDVSIVMDQIIHSALSINSVDIPGIK